MFELCLGLLCLASVLWMSLGYNDARSTGRSFSYLVRSVSSQAADSRLNSTRGAVNIGLESRGVLVRHVCGLCVWSVLVEVLFVVEEEL